MADGRQKARFRFACSLGTIAVFGRGTQFPDLVAQAFEFALVGPRAAAEAPQGKRMENGESEKRPRERREADRRHVRQPARRSHTRHADAPLPPRESGRFQARRKALRKGCGLPVREVTSALCDRICNTEFVEAPESD